MRLKPCLFICTTMEEIWRFIDYKGVDKEKYIINVFGDVKSLARKKVVFLKRQKNGKGYQSYFLTIGHILIHRLVASAFLPNPEKHPVVNHLDGDKKNNHASNLEWCSYSTNNKHAFDKGLNKCLLGSKRHTSIINEECVYLIRFLSEIKKMKIVDISKKLGVSRYIVHSVKHRKSWKHI